MHGFAYYPGSEISWIKEIPKKAIPCLSAPFPFPVSPRYGKKKLLFPSTDVTVLVPSALRCIRTIFLNFFSLTLQARDKAKHEIIMLN